MNRYYRVRKPNSCSAAKYPLTLAGVLALALAATGCSLLSYTSPSGERFSRYSFGTKTAIASLNVQADTNGVRRVELQGYQNDANTALSTVTEAAVRAAVGGGVEALKR